MEVAGSNGWNGSVAAVGPGMPKRDPLYIVLPMTVMYGCIFVCGVVGNLITCLVIARHKYMHTATNYYLFSLALSDLLLLISGLPQEMYIIWSRYPYVFGEIFCVGRGLASETSANATVLAITAFTVERYVAICHPFLAHATSNLSRATKSVLVIWLLALTAAVPQALQFGVERVRVGNERVTVCAQVRVLIAHSWELSTLLFFVAPMALISVLYALIALRLRKTPLAPAKRPNCHHHPSSPRVLRMLVAVVVAFFICWAPFHAQRLVAIYGANMASSKTMMAAYEVVTYISGVLYYVSTTINPILYHIMSHKFRAAFKDSLRCWSSGEGEHSALGAPSGTESSCRGQDLQSGNPFCLFRCCQARQGRNVCERCRHDISNSSLKDVDRTALRQELDRYLQPAHL